MSENRSRSREEMILVGYDGSEDARTAIEEAGKLLGGQPATVLTVWGPFREVLERQPSASRAFPALPPGRRVHLDLDRQRRDVAVP
jgi:hypothetical protein